MAHTVDMQQDILDSLTHGLANFRAIDHLPVAGEPFADAVYETARDLVWMGFGALPSEL